MVLHVPVGLPGYRPRDAGALPALAAGLGGGCRAGRCCPPQGVLADFAPPTPPLVPALVVQCVTEVETRGLTEVGAGAVGAAMLWFPRG